MHAGIIMSISTNEYTGKHASRRGNSILVVLISSIKNIFIVDAKVPHIYSFLEHVCLTIQIDTYHTVQSLYPHQHTLDQH